MTTDPADLPPDRQHPDDVCMCGDYRKQHAPHGCKYPGCSCRLFRPFQTKAER